jgi:hypothetical protein
MIFSHWVIDALNVGFDEEGYLKILDLGGSS